MSIVNKNGEVVLSSKKIGDFLVYPITHNLVDIFWGDGFLNTARFKFYKSEWVLWKSNKSIPSNTVDVLKQFHGE